MKGRILGSIVMTTIGASLLAAAMFAGSASGAGAAAEAKKGGTITTVSRSDFDYVDPALAYFSHSWNMMSATNLTLTYYPHTEGPARQRLAGMAAPLPRVTNSGKTYTFRIKNGFKFSNGANVTAANFKRAFDRGKQPCLAVARAVVHGRRRELQGGGSGLHRHAQEGGSGLHGPDVDAVLLGGAGEPAVHRRGHQGARSSRPARTTSRNGT